ncbi:MAG: alanine racemase [Elusimicrobia bacterium]|nr:alanine racemase [Elusimicrobiota bacterium]
MTASVVPPYPQRFFRPTWAEVDLSRFRGNLKRFRAKMGPKVKVCVVVKGNAYGHGAVPVAQAAEKGGASWLGVSSVEEGMTLRDAGLRAPILVLGSLYPFESFLAAVRYGLTPTVASLAAAQRLAEVARTMDAAVRVKCHVKLDTGMGRIGMSWPAGLRAIDFIRREPRLELEGVYTHLACAETGDAFTAGQLKRFKAALMDIRALGVKPGYAHAANSAAALRRPESRFDMVRPGLALYGLYGAGFEPILSLKSRVVFIKNVTTGTPISYGASFRTKRSSRIATLPIGYADGYPRSLSNKARVLVHGVPCPVVGAVTMDMTMVDVTKVADARVGDEAVLMGASGRESVDARDLAKAAGTIPYEITTQISARVPRVVVNG